MEDVKEIIYFNPKEVLPEEGKYVLAYTNEDEYIVVKHIKGQYNIELLRDDMIIESYWACDGVALDDDEVLRWAYIPKPSLEDR